MMSEEAQELAELMGWTHNDDCWINPKGRYNLYNPNYVPAYDTDLNAMREVWKVLKEWGLWDDFIGEFNAIHISGRNPSYILHAIIFQPWFIFQFLNDLPGQVQAAIKVLKGANEDKEVT